MAWNTVPPFTIAPCFPSSNSGCPIFPALLAIGRVTSGMISAVELVKVDSLGIFGGGCNSLLSCPTGERTITYFAPEYLSIIG